jgi:hypothetical protein
VRVEDFSKANLVMTTGGEGVDGLLKAMVDVVWWPKARKTTTEVFYYWSLVVKNL